MTDEGIKQLKMADGSEVIVEVLEDDPENSDDIIVRRALALNRVMTSMDSYYYVFKPWMTYTESGMSPIALNRHHITGMCIPHEKVLSQYWYACATLKKDFEAEVAADEDALANLIEEEVERMEMTLDSSGPDNVINLFKVEKSKLH